MICPLWNTEANWEAPHYRLSQNAADLDNTVPKGTQLWLPRICPLCNTEANWKHHNTDYHKIAADLDSAVPKGTPLSQLYVPCVIQKPIGKHHTTDYHKVLLTLTMLYPKVHNCDSQWYVPCVIQKPIGKHHTTDYHKMLLTLTILYPKVHDCDSQGYVPCVIQNPIGSTTLQIITKCCWPWQCCTQRYTIVTPKDMSLVYYRSQLEAPHYRLSQSANDHYSAVPKGTQLWLPMIDKQTLNMIESFLFSIWNLFCCQRR